MQRSIIIVGGLAAAFLSSPTRGDSPETTEEAVREIVTRSLPYIQEEGTWWREEKQCHSCHRTSFTRWALNRASEAGIRTDADETADWNRWSVEWINFLAPERREEAEMESTLDVQNDAVGQLILGRPTMSVDGTSTDTKVTTQWLPRFHQALLRSQQENGSWKPGGQLPTQKRPARETQEVTTMWDVIALLDYGEGEAVEAAVNKADAWLGDQTRGKSTEWWAVRLLMQRQTGTGEPDQTRQKLLAHQREDGGWGWLVDDASDALATGIALYALARDGMSRSDPAARRAIEFLANGQQDDGSWKVHGTKMNAKDRVTETASYWGTCWAIIGLLELPAQDERVAQVASP